MTLQYYFLYPSERRHQLTADEEYERTSLEAHRASFSAGCDCDARRRAVNAPPPGRPHKYQHNKTRLVSNAHLCCSSSFTVSRLIVVGLRPRTSASQFLHLHLRFVLFVHSLWFVEFCIVWFLFYFQFLVILLPSFVFFLNPSACLSSPLSL